ncbi:hypothetical protein EDL81_04020 [Ehrlichia ruminantium]|uniref:hypothetical protein n=1 Tax=Ehrlichia ruminantium TaxID=779 RepID=UPI00130E1FD7|nr:hypothetical protein [Ehrlichia ruminantium]QGR02784.1 hypothetical protein EDL81_04020 [Ehrlichia ruminantium]
MIENELGLYNRVRVRNKRVVNRTRLSANKLICTFLKPMLRLNSKILYNGYYRSAVNQNRQCGDLGVLGDSLIQLVEKSCDILSKPGLFHHVHIRDKEINRMRLSAYVIVLEWSNAITTLISCGVFKNEENIKVFKILLLNVNFLLYTISFSCKLLMQNVDCTLRDYLLVASAIDYMKYFSNLINKHITSKVEDYIYILNTSIDDISAVELFSSASNRTKSRMFCL